MDSAGCGSRVQSALPHTAHMRIPYVGILPAGEPHQPDGSADNAHHACAQLAPAEHPRVDNNDRLRPAFAPADKRHHRLNSADVQPQRLNRNARTATAVTAVSISLPSGRL